MLSGAFFKSSVNTLHRDRGQGLASTLSDDTRSGDHDLLDGKRRPGASLVGRSAALVGVLKALAPAMRPGRYFIDADPRPLAYSILNFSGRFQSGNRATFFRHPYAEFFVCPQYFAIRFDTPEIADNV